jgi:hypothetical protein
MSGSVGCVYRKLKRGRSGDEVRPCYIKALRSSELGSGFGAYSQSISWFLVIFAMMESFMKTQMGASLCLKRGEATQIASRSCLRS